MALRPPRDPPVRASHRCLPTRPAADPDESREVITERAPVYPRMLDELAPQALHRLEQYATTESKPTTGQLKRRLRPMRGLMTDRGAAIVIAGHALIQNIRRGHYELAAD